MQATHGGVSPDRIVDIARVYIKRFGHGRFGPEIQALMDAVSGVSSYKMGDRHNQGYIYKKFMTERIDSNHIIDFDELVGKFWLGVFDYLDSALPQGTKIAKREEYLKNGHGKVPVSIQKRHGRFYSVKSTMMDPIVYLRSRGLAYARKYVIQCYKERLRQECQDCGTINTIGSTFEIQEPCPKCGSRISELQAGFMRRRTRRCGQLDSKSKVINGCGHTRPAKLKRICGRPVADADGIVKKTNDGRYECVGGCGSFNVNLIQAEKYSSEEHDVTDDGGEDDIESVSGFTDPEDSVSQSEAASDASAFASACVTALPPDPRDPTGDSQSRKILRVLVEPGASLDMCKSCNKMAIMVCVDGCGESTCTHSKVPDPKMSCGSRTFSFEDCVNYSKKIGDYFGYTASLANRRVAKVREHVLTFAQNNKHKYTTAKFIVNNLTA